MTRPRSLVASILITVAGVVAYVVGRSLHVPGVDAVAFEHLLATVGSGVGFFGPLPSSVFGVGLGWLAVLWLIEGFAFRGEPSGRGASLLFAGFLVVAAFTSFAHAAQMQSIGYADMGVEVVPEPGLRFLLLATLTQTAGAAFLWFLCRQVGWRGFGQGLFVLLGVELLGHAATSLLQTAAYLEVGMVTPVVALLGLLLGVAPLVIGLSLLAFRRVDWPFDVFGGLRLRGAVDVLVVPYLAMAAGPWLTATLLSVGSPPLPLPGSLPGLAALACAVLVAILLGSRGTSGLRIGYLLGGILAPLVGLAALVALFVARAGVGGLAPEPGPFAGESCVAITLESDATGVHRDADALRARLEALDVRGAEITSPTPARIQLRVDGISDAGRLTEVVLEPRRLAFRMVAKDQTRLQPTDEPLDLAVERDYDTNELFYVAPNREALAPLLARLDEPSDALIECRPGYHGSGDEKCSAWLLDAPALTGADVEGAEVAWDDNTGRPEIMLRFDSAGADKFAEVTAANVGKKLAIVVDDRINSMPKIMEAITGGSARITLGGYGKSREELMEEARSTAAALSPSGQLAHDWRVTSIAACH